MSATTYACPNGHLSSDPDYCSECGKKLSPGSDAGSALANASGEICPDCGTPRATSGATFCEVCRYNFATKQPWSPDAPLAAAPAPAVSAPPASVSPAPGASAPPQNASQNPTQVPPVGGVRRWEAVAVVDPALCADPADPANPVPVGTPERVFPLDFAENLIGRRSERRAIYPEIDLSGDSGISARHALLYREADGTLTLLDVGSTNGTQINGAEVTPGVRVPLSPGDQVTLGCWTRLTLRVVGEKP